MHTHKYMCQNFMFYLFVSKYVSVYDYENKLFMFHLSQNVFLGL